AIAGSPGPTLRAYGLGDLHPICRRPDGQRQALRRGARHQAGVGRHTELRHHQRWVIRHLLGEEIQSVLDIKTPPIHYRESAQTTTDVGASGMALAKGVLSHYEESAM